MVQLQLVEGGVVQLKADCFHPSWTIAAIAASARPERNVTTAGQKEEKEDSEVEATYSLGISLEHFENALTWFPF